MEVKTSKFTKSCTCDSAQEEIINGTAGLLGSGTTTTTFQYVYDDNGNITQIKNASGVVQYQYTYDDLGQLIREDNRPLNKSYTWTYDNAGNRIVFNINGLFLRSNNFSKIFIQLNSFTTRDYYTCSRVVFSFVEKNIIQSFDRVL